MTNKEHWSCRLLELSWHGKPLVKSIVQTYMCNECVNKGMRGVCVHKKHLVPRHIDGTDGNPVRLLMDILAKGSYELECLGVADFIDTSVEKLFADLTLDKLAKNRINVGDDIINACNTGLRVAIDPTPSNVSGIGLVAGIICGGHRIVSIRYVTHTHTHTHIQIQQAHRIDICDYLFYMSGICVCFDFLSK